MKLKTVKNSKSTKIAAVKYSLAATLRKMGEGHSFVLPENIALASLYVGANQVGAKIRVGSDAAGNRRCVCVEPAANGEKGTYPIDKNVKVLESKRGRKIDPDSARQLAMAGKPAKASKKAAPAKAAKLAKKPAKATPAKKAAPVKKAPAKAKASKPAAKKTAPIGKPAKVMLGGKKVVAPALPFTK